MTANIPRVLFAFSDTGAGHRSAAIAMRAALEELSTTPIQCELLDVLRSTDFPILRSSPHLYNTLSTTWLPLFNMAYTLTNGRWQMDVLSTIVFLHSRANIVREICATRPHLVVVDHPLVQRLVCAARRVCQHHFRIVTVVTDLVNIHYAWTCPEVDMCCVPTDEAYTIMRRRGMAAEKIRRTGFPVHPKFVNASFTPPEARRHIQVEEHCSTMLVTSGGVGAGQMGKLVLKLEQACPDVQLLVVTGNNHALYEHLHRMKRSPHTHLYGFVQNMEVMMAASDMVVTKAGPGTLMEALVMRRPVIVTEAVGLQEEGNIDFVVRNGTGLYCPTIGQVVEAITTLQDEQFYADTVACLDGAVIRDGAYQVARLLLAQLGEDVAVMGVGEAYGLDRKQG
jgi:UDP-N-acetylglucosamine:LPS N-acetylglucosamine transferase